MEAPPSKQLQWNEARVVLLLNLVIAKGLHLKEGQKGVSAEWAELNKDFFKNDLLIDFKANYNPDEKRGWRKLKDKFILTMQTVKRNIECGNQTGGECDRSQLSKLVEQIKNDQDGAGEDDGEEERLKKETTEFEALALQVMASGEPVEQKLGSKSSKLSQGNGKRKHIDGSNTNPAIKKTGTGDPPASFESILSAYLLDDQSRTVPISGEEACERSMNDWVKLMKKDISSAMLEAKIVDANSFTSNKLEEIGIEVLISIYCTRGENFSARLFKEAMAAEGLSSITCHKLYALMQSWRVAATS